MSRGRLQGVFTAVSKANSVFFLESAYEEAYELLLECREYIQVQVPEIRKHSSQAFRLTVNVETMRLTTRVTQSMAWLLTQKAVFLEELSPDQASKHVYRLGAEKICLDEGAMDYDILPMQLRRLLDRSLDLYRRIHHLDKQLAASERPPAPVRLADRPGAVLTTV